MPLCACLHSVRKNNSYLNNNQVHNHLNVSSLHFPQEESMTANELELKSLKESLQDTQPVGVIVNCCHTLDQVLFSSKIVFYSKFSTDFLIGWLKI